MWTLLLVLSRESPCFGVAVGNQLTDVDPLNGSGNVDLQQRAFSINAREFSDKPFFGDGSPKQIGDLESVLSIDYDANNNQYVVIDAKGNQIDVYIYIGEHNNWKKLQENRDIDNRYKPSQFVDFALGGQRSRFGVAIGNIENFRVGFHRYEPRATSINCCEFYNKVWFGDGKPRAIGDLVTVFAIEYDAKNDNYYVVGEGLNRQIDVWYGIHNNWTKLQDNRDTGNRYSTNEFIDFSIGSEPDETTFGVAIGNKILDVIP
ncbi:MAG: hypothetical protein AAF927_34630 [Bacteroidota bacterium]